MDRIIAIAYNRALHDQRQTKGSWFLRRSILDGDHCQRRKIQFVFQQATGFFIRKDFFRCSCQHSIYPRLAKSGWFKEVCEWNICFLQRKGSFVDEESIKETGGYFHERYQSYSRQQQQETGGMEDILERGECWSSSLITEVKKWSRLGHVAVTRVQGNWHAYAQLH